MVIRGQRTLALACRRPNGQIYRYREALRSPLQHPGPARWPFVRGVIVLWESLAVGMRMLLRSADVQLEGVPPGESGVPPGESTEPQQLGRAGQTAVMGVSLVAVLLVFVGLPYVATQALRAAVESGVVLNLLEGALRLGLFLGYLVAISFVPDIRRVFAYHGAEHMTIHAFEHGEPLEPARIRPYPTAHPRCGTAFLLFVVFVTIVLFAFLPRVNPFVDLVARLLLVVPVAAISYELLRFGASHERHPLVRLIVAPGLLLQRITTRRPDEAMIEIAVASFEEALAGDRTAA